MDYFNDDESIANEVRDKRCMFKSTMCGMTDIERAFFLHKQREVFLIYNERVSLDHRLHNHAIDYQLKDYKNGLESAKYQILDQTHEYKIERTNSYGIKSIFTVCFNNKTRLTHSPDYVDNILKMHHIDVLAVNCEIHDLLQKNTKLKQALNVVFNSPIDLVNTFISKQFERGTFDGVIVNFAGPFFHVLFHDGHFEELSRQDCLTMACTTPVLEERKFACYRHAAKLKQDSKISLSSKFDEFLCVIVKHL